MYIHLETYCQMFDKYLQEMYGYDINQENIDKY